MQKSNIFALPNLLHIILIITEIKINVSIDTPKLNSSSIIGSDTNTIEGEVNNTTYKLSLVCKSNNYNNHYLAAA